MISLSYAGLPEGCASANELVLQCTPSGPGAYSVVAWAVDLWGGNFSSPDVPLTVSALPSLTISPSVAGGVGPLFVTFQATVAGGTPPDSVSWVFGDGGTSAGLSPSHTFSAADSYHIAAFLNDSLGATSRAGVTIVVTIPLAVTLTASPGVVDVGGTVVVSVGVTGGQGPYRQVTDSLEPEHLAAYRAGLDHPVGEDEDRVARFQS